MMRAVGPSLSTGPASRSRCRWSPVPAGRRMVATLLVRAPVAGQGRHLLSQGAVSTAAF